MLTVNAKKLEDQMAAKQKESNDKAKADQKTINELEKQLAKKDKDFKII